MLPDPVFQKRGGRSLSITAAIAVVFLALFGVAACTPPANKRAEVQIKILADGRQISLELPAGSTVQDALGKAGITLNNLDQLDPPSYTPLADQAVIRVTRVSESFQVEEVVIPFERQTVRNESLPEGQTLLIQPGVNGVQQITYRRVFEDGTEVSRTVFKTAILSEAMPEIVMVGVQTPFTSVAIRGKLAYLTNGNAWIMEKSTGDRRPLVTTGDLDGRVFSLSADGRWLLYTRKSAEETGEVINTMWAVDTNRNSPQPVNLRAANVIHFAAWVPGTSWNIAYSTVEARPTAPGWQANNDLQMLTLTSEGNVLQGNERIAANSGGIYGWWGTNFFWSSDGSQLAYARPDSVGLVDIDNGEFIPLVDLIPFQTRSDWAWVPGVGWAPDNNALFTVTHAPSSGLTTDEASPFFDLSAILVDSGLTVHLVPQSGMFAYPVPSPLLPQGRYQIAYLQAIFPEQSETSRYRLVTMDRDGSNRSALFPPEGSPGIEPQQIVWAPEPEDENLWLALIYQGNLWIINSSTGQSQQITGDGSIGKIDWR